MKIVTSLTARLVCIALLLRGFSPTAAQTTYLPITPENAAQVEQIKRIGNGVVRELTFSRDGSRLAVGTALGVWLVAIPVQEQHPTPVLSPETTLLEEQGAASTLAFSPDGSRIAAGGDDGSVVVWDATTGEVIARLENHLYQVFALAWAGRFIASGDQSGVVRLWDTTIWSEYRVFPVSDVTIHSILIDPDTMQLTVDTVRERVTLDIVTGAVLNKTLASFVADGVYTVGGLRVYHDAALNQINVWNENVLIITLNDFYGELDGVFFSNDGRVGANPLQSTYLWSLETAQVDDAPLPVRSPDGSRIATYGNDGSIRLSDAATGRQIAALHGHIRAVTGVAFSPNGRLLASSSNDGTIQLWDASVTEDSGSLVTLRGHTSGVTSVAFSADGTLVASTGYDGTVRLWGIYS